MLSYEQSRQTSGTTCLALPSLSSHVQLRVHVGRNVPTRVVLGVRTRLSLRPSSSRRRIHRRGILDLFDFALLAAALQGDFFLVDGHCVGVGFLAAARTLGLLG